MPNLRNGSKGTGDSNPGLRVRHCTAELPRSIQVQCPRIARTKLLWKCVLFTTAVLTLPACCSQSNNCHGFVVRASFSEDDCTEILEGDYFIALLSIHLHHDFHVLAERTIYGLTRFVLTSQAPRECSEWALFNNVPCGLVALSPQGQEGDAITPHR